MHNSLLQSLVDKINLYNKVFNSLFANEERIHVQYIKQQCKELLAAARKASTVSEKGRLFENLVELLFTSNNSLDLVDKRVSTGDEEIDLVIKNNIDRPFWLAFELASFLL